MNESVLNGIKKMLGVIPECKSFDVDILLNINSVLMILAQMGVVNSGTSISDEKTTWDDILDNPEEIEGIKSYLYLKVKLLFDPPTNTGAVTAIENMIREFEYRLYTLSDPIGTDPNYDYSETYFDDSEDE